MAKKSSKQIRERAEKLRELINHHRYLYHVLDRQEISEAALDSLKKELFDLEQKYPQFITPDSPTQRVGGEPLEEFQKVKHPERMLSLNDAFSEQDMRDWVERISKLLTEKDLPASATPARSDAAISGEPKALQAGKKEIDLPPHHSAKSGTGGGGFYCELKLDGLAIELIYEKGILKTGSTRGDGTIGENVTQNLKTIEAIPLKLREIGEIEKDLEKESAEDIKNNFKEIVVRGEVFCGKKEFERVNKEQVKKGLSPFANPRNMAAGSIRQLDPKITSQRRLDSYAYELITPARRSLGEGGNLGQKIPRSPSATGMAAAGLATHQEKHKILKDLGLKTNPHNKYCKNLNEVFEFQRFWQKEREKLPYEIDGIVVIINSNKIFDKLGVVGKTPRGAIAFKFPLKQATTIIEDIKIQIGRTGAITPVAYLKPVKVGGVTISRATLHNEDEIKRLGVKIGDTVIVGRAGDVIPDIVKVLTELRTGKEKEFRMPKVCPSCKTKLIKSIGETIRRCPNPKCFIRKRRYFYHFISRGAFNIQGLGPKIVDKLLSEGLIEDAADLFELEKGDLVPLERFAEKSAENLVSAIQEKKEITLPRFIYSLGIRNIGEETATGLAEHFSAKGGPASGWGSIEKLKKASRMELESILDIGPIVSKSICGWFKKKDSLEFLAKLKKAGIKISAIKQTTSQRLKGKAFALTGSLESMTREAAKEKIRKLGGGISDLISQNTDYLVYGQEPGSKLERAKKLGVKIVNEKEFLEILKPR